ncbi:6TM ABC transporter family protein [Amycolatopsis thermoflava]|uniref:hypothetical protein n=1 Tax=Amycolatopsis thermoflava TaxID=84480 RepID=UPI00365BBC43
MSERLHSVTNIAGPGSWVGLQTEYIHNSTIYITSPDAPPEEKFRVGLNHLRAGAPARAREWIEDAMAEGLDVPEVRYYWVLSMLSKRSYRDLAHAERERLMRRVSLVDDTEEEHRWSRALRAIRELLECLDDRTRDPGGALKRIGDLERGRREEIQDHLDLVLTGGIKDSLWAETKQRAKRDQCGNDRQGRVWAYFQPEPAPPRARMPAQEALSQREHIRLFLASIVFVVTICYLAWLLIDHGAILALSAHAAMLIAGGFAARHGFEWWYRVTRLRERNREFAATGRVNRAREGGFTEQVDAAFDWYFHRYAPRDADRRQWLSETAGFRRSLRDEIAEIYREQRTGVDKIRWLIRFLVRQVALGWEHGTLWEYRKRYRVAVDTKVWCGVALGAAAATCAAVVWTVLRAEPVGAVIACLLTAASGAVSIRGVAKVLFGRRRFLEEHQESQDKLQERQEEYERWRNKLDRLRPSDHEMETWLRCDRTLLLAYALEHFRLRWSDILAHTFIQSPAAGCKRARVPYGPSRYSRYDIRLFLITRDGVREVGADLDFENVTRDERERNNFRFDAVSSVHVGKVGSYGYKLTLTLMNGEPQKIEVTDPGVADSTGEGPAESPAARSALNLDAAGFSHALHILEGIAAEGKEWINRDPHAIG